MRFRPMRIVALACGISAATAGCSRAELTVVKASRGASTIQGKVVFPFAANALAGEPCDDRKIAVALYGVNDAIAVTPPLATAAVHPETRAYVLDVAKAGVKLSVYPSYKVVTIACGSLAARILTGPSAQNVTPGSTLLSYAVAEKDMAFADAGAFAQDLSAPAKALPLDGLTRSLEAAPSTEDAFRLLSGDATLAARFTDVFGLSPLALTMAPPRILAAHVPASGRERESIPLSVSARHWDPTYRLAFVWKTEDADIGTGANASFRPNANAQGNHTVTLLVGRAKAQSPQDVDLALGYVKRDFALQVSDDFPATPPAMTLAEPALAADEATGGRALTLTIVTGNGRENCESFSKLALTENTSLAPLDPKAYAWSCARDGSQRIPYTLVTPGDGTKALRLWAMDAAGRVSKTASLVTVRLDETPPGEFTITAPGPFVATQTPTVTWSAADDAVSYHLTVGTDAGCATVVQDYLALTSPSRALASLGEGTYVLCLSAIDGMGNIRHARNSGMTMVVDVTPPGAFTITAPAALQRTRQATPAISWTASADASTYDLMIGTAPGCPSPVQAHAGLSGTSYALTSALPEGNYVTCVTAKDAAGNVRAAGNTDLAFTVDTTPPGPFSFTLGSAFFNTATPALSWAAATDAATYDLRIASASGCATPVQSLPALTGTSRTLSALADGAYYLCLSAADDAGNVTAAGNDNMRVRIDTQAPVISAFSVNGGSGSTANRYVRITLAAADEATNVTHFCVKYNDASQPGASDACWVAVNAPSPGLAPSPNLNVPLYYFPLGITPGTYTLHAWVKDEAQNISALGGGGAGTQGVDTFAVSYAPGSPPVVVNVLASSSDVPADPPTALDLTATAGQTVVVKWKATASNGLDAAPISLHYTTDDRTYQEIASGLANGANGSCLPDNPGTSADDGGTGCYVWTNGAPTSGYFRVQVRAKDTAGQTSLASASPINANAVNVLAGNVESGLFGSAASAVFLSDAPSANLPDAQSFVVARDGTMYYRQPDVGILKVSPADGILDLLVPTTGTASGDGGPASAASLRYPYKIALDFRDRLLVFDHDRIRRIDTTVSPATIDTIIGGGASASDGVSAASVLFDAANLMLLAPTLSNYHFAVLLPLPNGDVFFTSDRINRNTYVAPRLRHYHADTGLVDSVAFTGAGTNINPGMPMTQADCGLVAVAAAFDPLTSSLTQLQGAYAGNCGTSGWTVSRANFDPRTGVATAPHPPGSGYLEDRAMPIQARNGGLYLVNRDGAMVKRFNDATNSWDLILGGTGKGVCPDGTAATACHIDITDAFVDEAGTFYFVERGRIRTIGKTGHVVTLMGQSLSFGDGGKPLSARFNRIGGVRSWNDGGADRFVVLDTSEIRFREFTPGGTISSLAGTGIQDGYINLGVPAKDQGFHVSQAWGMIIPNFIVSPSDGSIYYGAKTWHLNRLNRGSGLWEDVFGGGTTPPGDPAAEGLPGSQIGKEAGPGVGALGFDGTRILALTGEDNALGGLMNMQANLYDAADGTLTHFVGIHDGAIAGVTMCADGVSLDACAMSAYADRYTAYHWDAYTGQWLGAYQSSDRIQALKSGQTVATFVTLPRPVMNFTYRRDAGLTYSMLYYCGTDGKLHKYDMLTSTETDLPWPIPGMSCGGNILTWMPGRNSLLFSFTQNGLSGVAEHVAP